MRWRQTRTVFRVELRPNYYLFLLCGLFLVLVLINGAFKYVINVYEGIVGERMLRRLRYELFRACCASRCPISGASRTARSSR